MRSHDTGPKMCETVTLTGTIWKWFLNGARWKRNSSRCRVNIKFVTFWLHFSAQPPVSQNSNQLNCFLCYFLCPFWKVWGLSGLMQTCQQILTTSCEYTRAADIFSCQNRVNILVLNQLRTIVPRKFTRRSWVRCLFRISDFTQGQSVNLSPPVYWVLTSLGNLILTAFWKPEYHWNKRRYRQGEYANLINCKSN